MYICHHSTQTDIHIISLYINIHRGPQRLEALTAQTPRSLGCDGSRASRAPECGESARTLAPTVTRFILYPCFAYTYTSACRWKKIIYIHTHNVYVYIYICVYVTSIYIYILYKQTAYSECCGESASGKGLPLEPSPKVDGN